MKKYILSPFTLVLAMLLGIALTTVSCNDDDSGSGVVLKSFGPTPALRGTPIRFIGDNMNKVTRIIFPENVEVTDITVVNNNEITAVVPQSAAEGKVTLVYKGGQVTSVGSITYTEPFSITEISPVGALIREGDVVTIDGDYLNNIVTVVFSGDAAVEQEEFLSQTREVITLKLPAAAVSGKLYIADEYGNQLYSDQELTVQQPTVASVTTAAVKPGQTITIEGTDLDLIEYVTFTGGSQVNTADFVSQSATRIVVKVPDDAADGPVTVTAYSGQAIVSEDTVLMVIPADLAVKAVTRYKAGLKIEITGSDLDLVTVLTFNGMGDEETEFTYAGGKITAAIPAKATDGVITLATAADKSVETPVVTLVKAVITALNPETITAGESFTITGTDLDLAVSVKINGGPGTIAEGGTAAGLTIGTPLNATGGLVELTAANGDKTVSATPLTVNASTKPTVTGMPGSAMPGDIITLTGTNLNYVDAVYFGAEKVRLYSVRTATELTFTIPVTAPLGKTRIKLVTIDGEEVMTDQQIAITGQEPIVDQSLVIMDYEPHGGHDGSWDGSWGLGSTLMSDNTNYLKLTAAAAGEVWVINCNHQADGAPGPVIGDASQYVLKIDIKLENDIPTEVSDAMNVVLGDSWNGWINNFFPKSADGSVYTTGGGWMTLTFDLNSIGYSGTVSCASGTNGLYWKGSVPFDFNGVCIDNMRFQKK